MQMQSDQAANDPEPGLDQPREAELESSRAPRPISELIPAPDFPRSALGELVDIGGYVGVVVDLVNQSLKVRSSEGVTKSFNAGGLRKLYGPRIIPDPIPEPAPTVSAERPREIPKRPVASPSPPSPPPPPPKRELVLEPDFTKPVKNISAYVTRPDYPRCMLGEHVEIAGYSGVVVELVNRSLKVRSRAEITRSYNADALRKLYGPP
jgi:hypothetical protein